MKLIDVLDAKGRDVVAVDPGISIREAVRTLVAHNIGAVAVVDRAGELVGIFSERDVLRLSDSDSERNFAAMRISEHMSSELITAECQTAVDEALAIMTDHRVRHLPVVTKGKLRGMVSQGDLVKAMLEDARHETKQLTDFVLGKYPA